MYLKLTNGVPEIYSIGKLRRDNPQTSFPKELTEEMLVDKGVYSYTRPSRPTFSHFTERVVDDSFKQNEDGTWELPYKIEQLPLDRAETNIRSKRDQLLSDTDWMVVKSYESGQALPDNIVAYRQALRDITAQTGFPYTIEWPSELGNV